MPNSYDTYAGQRARADDTRWPGARDLAYEDPVGAIAAGTSIGGLFEGIPFFDELGNLIPAPVLSFVLGMVDDIPILGDLLEIIMGISDGEGIDPSSLLSGFFDGLRTFLPFLPDLGDGTKSPVEGAADFIQGILNPANILAFFNPGLIPGLDASKITSGFFPMGQVANLPSTFIGAFGGFFNAVFGAGSSTATTVAAASIEAEEAVKNLHGRVTRLEGGGVMTTHTVSGTWTNPDPGEHRLVTVIVVGGGDGGDRPGPSIFDNAKGGRNGGYVSRELYLDELGATVALTIGAGGAGATAQGRGAAGGTTSFGAHVVSKKGLGAIYKADGTYAVAIAPGNGGDGAFAGGESMISSTGGASSAFANGGAAGFGTNEAGATGLAGQAAPVGIPSGGAGGGGGSCYNNLGARTPAPGGAGGFPGGGGGAGASGATAGDDGANGAAGCIYIIDPEG
jgi:hypothetical protein